MIKIRLFFTAKSIVGKEELLVQANTLREILEKLINDYPKLKRMLLKNEGELKENVFVMINGSSIRDINTPLKDGDTVVIFEVISGG